MRSESSAAPTRSWLRMAAKASSAASSAASSRLRMAREPKLRLPETSTARNTVRSRSSTYCLTKGVPMRAVTFQSMVRTSSPGW